MEEAFTEKPEQWWRDALRHKINALLWEQIDTIEEAVCDALRAAIQDGALTDPDDDSEDADDDE